MRIVVVGCGWLGLPLAATLARDGHDVHGTTTGPDREAAVAQAGVAWHRLVLGARVEGDSEVLTDADGVVVAVPPSGTPDRYPDAVAALAREAGAREVRHLLMCSSTGVYAGARDHPRVGEADVGTPASPRAERLLAAEAALREGPVPVTIARLAGLWGHGRHPVRSLAGRELDGADVPVNLVHRDDAIVAVTALMVPRPTLGTYAVVADHHPPRGAFYTSEAHRLGLEPPSFRDTPGSGKRVSGDALAAAVGVRPRWAPGDPEAP